MVLEHGTKSEMEDSAYEACLPLPGERWLMMSGSGSFTLTPMELTVTRVDDVHVRILGLTKSFHYNMKVSTWLELLREGRMISLS
jgi:hypothetical protein